MIRFVLTVEAKDGQAGIHDLRWFLKRLRDRGLRCVDAYELGISNDASAAFRELREEVIAERESES